MLSSSSHRSSAPCQFQAMGESEIGGTQFSELRSWERVSAWIPFSNSLQ